MSINPFDFIQTPCYVLEENKFIKNLELLHSVELRSKAKILLALKGFAFWREFDIAKRYLSGTTASGIYEARLGYEEFGGANDGKEVCVFSPAFKEREIDSLLDISTHIIFNSFAQWQKYKSKIESKNKVLYKKIQVGLRVNPLYSEVSPPIYNPCIEGSRLGITPSEFEKGIREFGLDGISGLHFHTHCEQNSDALVRTLVHFEGHFGKYIEKMKWINFGGGHHITRVDYDVDTLVSTIVDFRKKYNGVEVFLEPGEAVGWQCGFLIGEVVDIVFNGKNIAILDVSASAHMPDCLEMPYRPEVSKISNGVLEDDICGGKYEYRFGGPTCLAGDVMGDYSFDSPLKVGDKVIFKDMIHYTIVKNTTFNGVPLPSLGVIDKNNKFLLLKSFDYDEYKRRNG